MTKFFISYAREDIEFSRKLVSSLEHLGYESWIDWNDIPPTADWWEQIEKGIETSDTFLFLVSPDSVSSENCRKEIDHAAQNGKRIIPIVVIDFAWDALHPAIAKLNCIFFRPHDNYEIAIKKLDTAIRIDLSWVEAHRRLQVRALEWQKRKERSLLLRGDDLRTAEEQLATSGQKDPQPTDLQRKFLLASRRSDSRTRNLIGLISILIAIALGYTAWTSFQNSKSALEGKEQTFVAESTSKALQENTEKTLQDTKYQLRQSRIGQLSAQSEQLAEISNSASLLLALESARLSDNAGEPITEGTRHALQDALGGVQGDAIYANDKNVVVIAFSPDLDGRWLASAGEDGIIRLWDRDSPTVGSQPVLLIGHDGSVYSLAFSNNGSRLASGGEDGVVRIWDLKASDPSSDPIRIPVHGRIMSLAWDSKDRWLAAGISNQGMSIIDMSTSEYGITSYLSSNYTNEITIKDSTGDCTNYINEPWWGGAGLIPRSAPNCTYVIYRVGGIGDIYVTAKWDEPWFAAANSSQVDLWKIPSTDNPPLPRLQTEAAFAAFSPDGKWMTTAKPGEIDLWSLNPLSARPIVFTSDERKGGAVYGLVYSPDGKWMAISNSYENEVLLWKVPDLSLEDTASTRELDGTQFFRLTGHTGPVTAMAFSPNSKWLATSSGDVVRLSADPEIASQFNALPGDGTTRLWYLAAVDPAKSSILFNTNSQYAALTFSPDSKYLAASSENLLMRLFELPSNADDLNSKSFGINDLSILDRLNPTDKLNPDDFTQLLDLVCKHATRNFTHTEWALYGFTESYRATCPQWPLEP